MVMPYLFTLVRILAYMHAYASVRVHVFIYVYFFIIIKYLKIVSALDVTL
jgi:hypothetical protein